MRPRRPGRRHHPPARRGIPARPGEVRRRRPAGARSRALPAQDRRHMTEIPASLDELDADDPLPGEPWTELGYARRLIQVYGDRLLFLNASRPWEICTLSRHDALPI